MNYKDYLSKVTENKNKEKEAEPAIECVKSEVEAFFDLKNVEKYFKNVPDCKVRKSNACYQLFYIGSSKYLGSSELEIFDDHPVELTESKITKGANSISGSSISEIKEKVSNFEKFVNELIIAQNNFVKDYHTLKNKVDKVRSVKDDAHTAAIDNYNLAKESFITERYGSSDISIGKGKEYYLLDTKGVNKIALVEVLKKEDSGLGYKVIDHEAEKKYSHIDARRLQCDMRGFPSYFEV